MHFYLDHNKLPTTQQSFAQGYGPDSATSPPNPTEIFRVTSQLNLTGDAKIFAPMKGRIIVQPNDNDPTNLVNVILKPIESLDINFTAVKYFVFRGVKKDSFFTNTNAITPAGSGESDMINRLWDEFNDRNSDAGGTLPPPDASALGYDPSADSAIIIDSIYADQEILKSYLVKEGEWLGNYSGTVETGFEVVLEEGNFIPDLTFARKNEYVIDVTAISDPFDKKMAREEILNFCDPVALFGLYYLEGLDTVAGKMEGSSFYTSILEKYATKNRVYLDIRNQVGYSLNLYRNFDDGSGNSIKLGDSDSSASPQPYKTDDWPIVTIDGGLNTTDTRNVILLNIRIDDNIKPLVYLVHAEAANPETTKRFLDNERLLPATGDGYTQEMSFRLPNYDDSNTRLFVPWYLKMLYCREAFFTGAPGEPDNVLKTINYTDNIFGPLNLQRLGKDDDPFKFIFNKDQRYIHGKLPGSTASFGYIAERGISWDNNNSNPDDDKMIFFSRTLYANKSTSNFFSPTSGEATTQISNGLSLNNDFFNLSLVNQGLRLSFQKIYDGTEEIVLPIMDDNGVPPRNTENLLLLGITSSEFELINGFFTTLDFKTNHHAYIRLKADGSNPNKYQVVVHGIDASTAQDKESTYAFFVYSVDGLVFASKDFCSTVPSPTTYERNFEEAVGNRIKIEKKKRNKPISGINLSTNTIKISSTDPNLTDPFFEIPIHKTIEISGSTGNDGSYTVIETEKSASDSFIKVAQPLSNPTADGDITYSVSYEDYFISLDQEGSLGSTPDTMRKIVNDFQKEIEAIPNDSNAKSILLNAVNNYAPTILARARNYVQQKNGSDYKHPDDRLIYWARIKMEVILKSHPFLIQSIVDRKALVKLFEEKSRGYTSVDFSSTDAINADKKLLFVGFDPFGLYSVYTGKYYPLQGNPSGACSMSLHGKTINTGSKTVFVQAMIVPVRYRDFDGDTIETDKEGGTGIVEEYIAPFIGDDTDKADIIITCSQSGMGCFHIDRFGTINRGGGTYLIDNLNEVRPENSDSIYLTKDEREKFWDHLETTLPKHMAQEYVAGDNLDDWGNTTVYAQYYKGTPQIIDELPLYLLKWGKWTDEKKTFKLVHPDRALTRETSTSYINPVPNTTTMIKGSGGNYLSNEIFYRVSLARERWHRKHNSKPKFPTGHFHVAWVQVAELGLDLTDKYTIYDYIQNSSSEHFGRLTKPPIKTNRSIFDELRNLINTVEDRIRRGIENYHDENDLF